jgi:hypothetical protein
MAEDERPLALAEIAHGLVESDTTAGARLAARALGLARGCGDREAEVAALHALGFAQHELGDPRAIATLREAVRIAVRAGLARRAALARRPLAIYLAYGGEVRAAVRESMLPAPTSPASSWHAARWPGSPSCTSLGATCRSPTPSARCARCAGRATRSGRRAS